MSAPRKPALSDAEWRLVELWSKGKMPGGMVRGRVVLDLPDDHKHAAGALAIHNLTDADGRPLGFTREHVAMLREPYINLHDLADIVEAFLPPEGA